MGVFVIAEAACGWNGDLKQAEHSIRMAKVLGANAWKTQWTSDPMGMAGRRGINYSAVAEKLNRLAWPFEHHAELWALCREYDIEYMCTTFLQKDVDRVDQFVSRFKVSAFESDYSKFVTEHLGRKKQIIISVNPEKNVTPLFEAQFNARTDVKLLHCISKYPCPLDQLKLSALGEIRNVGSLPIMYRVYEGLSDHTTSTLTGALAVAAGATIIEKHVKTIDMKPDDPDQPHSLSMNGTDSAFGEYVRNIREAEKAL